MSAPDGEVPRESQQSADWMLARLRSSAAERDLHVGTEAVASDADTRRFLAREVYGVPEDLLDDVVRVRMEDLGR